MERPRGWRQWVAVLFAGAAAGLGASGVKYGLAPAGVVRLGLALGLALVATVIVIWSRPSD